MDFDGKKLLLTGGTGSFGHAFVDAVTRTDDDFELTIMSRDEMKQWLMAQSCDDRIKFRIGDVRDKGRLLELSRGVDHLVHAAATKIVPLAEVNPSECVKTNINGALNVIEACFVNKVKSCIALSTDKACNPVNLYGATKLASDKLFVSAGNQSIGSSSNTVFSVVRYGNVLGSRGSIVPFFRSIQEGPFPITDERMTRFVLTLPQAVDLVLEAFKQSVGGEVFVKKLPSVFVTDIAKAIDASRDLKSIGIRPGEKLHEQMITVEDAYSTVDMGSYFVIFPHESEVPERLKAHLVDDSFEYRSDTNAEWLNVAEIAKILEVVA